MRWQNGKTLHKVSKNIYNFSLCKHTCMVSSLTRYNIVQCEACDTTNKHPITQKYSEHLVKLRGTWKRQEQIYHQQPATSHSSITSTRCTTEQLQNIIKISRNRRSALSSYLFIYLFSLLNTVALHHPLLYIFAHSLLFNNVNLESKQWRHPGDRESRDEHSLVPSLRVWMY